MRTRAPASLAVATALFVAGAPAAAQSTAPPAGPLDVDAARERARPAFERGLALVERQAWAEALAAFLEAQAAYPSSVLAFDVGYCQRALGQSVAALATLRAFVAAETPGVAATRRDEALAYVRELEARAARVHIEVPSTLRDGAEVQLDGRPVTLDTQGRAIVVVDPGRHTVHVRRAGYAPAFEDRDVGPGIDASVSVSLRRLPARLVLRSNVADARVRLDGGLAGRVPFDAAVLAGVRQLEIAAPGYVAQTSRVTLRSGETTQLVVELEHERRALTQRWWFWTAVGAAVTLVGAGVSVGTYFATRPAPSAPPYQGGTLLWVVDPAP